MSGPTPFQLLRDAWDASTARADALVKGQPWVAKDTSLLGVFAGWAVTELGSTGVCDLMAWSPAELRALLSTERLGVAKVRTNADMPYPRTV